jgi:MFS transporter, FHS family, glucose/mannose:H+ symporter
MRTNIPSIVIVYLSGFLQGVALILYPAAGPIFTNPELLGLNSGQFGLLFTPQIILAIIASFSAPLLAKKWSMKRVLQAGLLANLLAMLLFAGSHYTAGPGMLPFLTLLVGTAALGTGFGFTITAVNPYAYSFFPGKEASAVTGLHILLGAGTASSSILLSYFSGLGYWWGAGWGMAAALLLLWLWMTWLPMPLKTQVEAPAMEKTKRLPGRIWVFFLVVFFYGACEATFGNWAPIYLEKEAGLSLAAASLGLSLFWGAIALGRLLFTLAALRFNLRWLHLLMPLLVAAIFFGLPWLEGSIANYVALFAAGLGLSFYFPFSISLATDEFPTYSAAVSGILVAAIQLGTGVSSNVIGLFTEMISLTGIIQFSALYAVLMAGIASYLYLTRKQPVVSAEKPS